MISSEKANNRAAAVIDFASRHKWAKYPCVAAVSVIYSTEFIRLKALELGERIKASAEAPFRPLGGRIVSFILSGAVAFMVLPFAAISTYAEEYNTEEQTTAEENVELPEAAAKKTEKAETPEAISQLVTLGGLGTDDPSYGITLNIPWLDREVTARFSNPEGIAEQVENAFESYGIPTEELNICPIDIVLYASDNRHKLNLRDGYSADITLPIPDSMSGHTDDLKVVRLEDDGSMTVIDGEKTVNENGRSITFNTTHFSVFAVVAYKNIGRQENVSSAAGVSASGISTDMSVSFTNIVLAEDKRRYKKSVRRKVYRIKRICKESDLLL